MSKKGLALRALSILTALFPMACSLRNHSFTAQPAYLSKQSQSQGILSEESAQLNSSTPPLEFEHAVVVTDNDTAFEEKLRLVRTAKEEIDLVYYIFSDDYSSSYFALELLAAAERGVRVRLLVDYFSSYANLDYFLMLEQLGRLGKGSLEVRFFNRPNDTILQDAVYLTMPCEEKTSSDDYRKCAEVKYETIERELAERRLAQGLELAQIPSNYSTYASGLFLSGLYSKDPELMAQALKDGAQFGGAKETGTGSPVPAEEKQARVRKSLEGAKVFWQTRSSNEDAFQKRVAEMKLWLAFLFYGSSLRPLYDKAAAYLPLRRAENGREMLRDWQFLTQFTHHKLLMVDSTRFVLGGRNMADSYHMVNNPLIPGYVFSDTDVLVELKSKSAELRQSFQRLWDYRTMTATLSDVLSHAPNDFAAAKKQAKEQCADTASKTCNEEAFFRNLDPALRIRQASLNLRARARAYEQVYLPRISGERAPNFEIDTEAKVYYLENLPFSKDKAEPEPPRLYQPENGREGESGKHIHASWLASLRQACTLSRAESPQEVVFHNAYFIPPANLLSAFAKMTDGTWDCPHVRLSVITNSPETTDLNVINLAARYLLEAYFSYLNDHRHEARGADFHYYEYQRQGGDAAKSSLSLHSKVNLIGPDVYIGSANADVRSYVLDTNNSLLIRNAPRFKGEYLNWLEGRLGQPSLIKEQTAFFSTLTEEELLAVDRLKIRSVLATILSENSPALEPVAEVVEKILIRLRDLSRKIVERKQDNALHERKYDSMFKLL
jgi:cardiolipin synthase C